MLAPRWRVVVALFAVTSCIAAAVSTFGVFLPVLSAAFVIGRVADRRGPRGVLAATVALGAVGFALSARIDALWHFYLSYGLLVGVGMSSIYVLSAATVARWFATRRGMALAIVLSGFNLGWLTAGPLAAWLIGRFGWRAAYVALGALIAAVGVPASLCVSYPQSAEARHVTAGTGARWPAGDRRLWYFVGAWGFLGFVYMMVTVHSVAYARDRGVPLEQASLALTAFGVGAIVGRLVAGAAADNFGVRTTMRVCLVIQAAALLAFVAGLPSWAVPATLVVFGLGGAGADNTIVKAVPDAFGLAALATIMSVVGLGWRGGAALGPARAAAPRARVPPPPPRGPPVGAAAGPRARGPAPAAGPRGHPGPVLH